MRLWTIQDQAFWKVCQERGGIYPEAKHPNGNWEWFDSSYRWMMAQMAKRLPNYSGKPPVWAWTHKPDLRSYKWTCAENQYLVLLTLEVPDDRVLLSDFHDWHTILNNCFYYTPEEEAKIDWYNDATIPKHTQEEIEASWERLFEFNIIQNHELSCKERLVQACIDQVHMSEIIKVRPFNTVPWRKKICG